MESSSSDSSDSGARVKNVRSLLLKSKHQQEDQNQIENSQDESCAYKQKLGDLVFDANFEGGNLGNVEQVDQYEYDLMCRPDVSDSRERMWFNFVVSNQRPNQCVVFTFTNLSQNFSWLFNEGFGPVVRSRLYPNWVRLKRDQVFYYKSPGHEEICVLSIALRFDLQVNNAHQIALFFPYTPTTLSSFVSRWTVELRRQSLRSRLAVANRTHELGSRTPSPLNRTCESRSSSRSSTLSNSKSDQQSVLFKTSAPNFKVEILAESVLSKPIYMLAIDRGETVSHPPACNSVIILGRTSGNLDSITSFVCQGFIDFMLSDDPIANCARNYMSSTVFPMSDPDSVWAGNSRTDIFGAKRHPANILKANPNVYKSYNLILERIHKLCEQSNRVVLVELKMNPNIIGSRTKGSLFSDGIRMERHFCLPKLMSRFADGFYLEKCKFTNKSSANPLNLLEELCENYNHVDHYQLELSPFAFYERSLLSKIHKEYCIEECKCSSTTRTTKVPSPKALKLIQRYFIKTCCLAKRWRFLFLNYLSQNTPSSRQRSHKS